MPQIRGSTLDADHPLRGSIFHADLQSSHFDDVMVGRGTVVRARVLAVHDDGEAQTIDVETHDGVVRTGIEVLSLYGHLSNPPAVGAVTALLAAGDDQGDYIALPMAYPRGRFGNTAPGETGVSDHAGNRVVVRAGGLIELLAAALIHLTSPKVKIDASGGTTINGPLTVNGDVRINGNLVVSGSIIAGGAIDANTATLPPSPGLA